MSRLQVLRLYDRFGYSDPKNATVSACKNKILFSNKSLALALPVVVSGWLENTTSGNPLPLIILIILRMLDSIDAFATPIVLTDVMPATAGSGVVLPTILSFKSINISTICGTLRLVPAELKYIPA